MCLLLCTIHLSHHTVLCGAQAPKSFAAPLERHHQVGAAAVHPRVRLQLLEAAQRDAQLVPYRRRVCKGGMVPELALDVGHHGVALDAGESRRGLQDAAVQQQHLRGSEQVGEWMRG